MADSTTYHPCSALSCVTHRFCPPNGSPDIGKLAEQAEFEAGGGREATCTSLVTFIWPHGLFIMTPRLPPGWWWGKPPQDAASPKPCLLPVLCWEGGGRGHPYHGQEWTMSGRSLSLEPSPHQPAAPVPPLGNLPRTLSLEEE